jgi:nuclear-control-of-ATPase protein 2
MRNLVSGRIARLVLIQLQFVKKELLVAMQAIDELFNANQVNLQLLAVTPAVLSIIMLQIFLRATITTIRSSSKGRFIESTWAVQRDLRSGMRQLEKLLSLSDSYNSQKDDLTIVERGKLISILFRLQNLLVMHSSRFDDISLRLLQVTRSVN